MWVRVAHEKLCWALPHHPRTLATLACPLLAGVARGASQSPCLARTASQRAGCRARPPQYLRPGRPAGAWWVAHGRSALAAVSSSIRFPLSLLLLSLSFRPDLRFLCVLEVTRLRVESAKKTTSFRETGCRAHHPSASSGWSRRGELAHPSAPALISAVHSGFCFWFALFSFLRAGLVPLWIHCVFLLFPSRSSSPP